MGNEFGADNLAEQFNIPSEDEDKFAMKILDTLFTIKDINFKTELSDKEIKILTKISVISEMLQSDELRTLVKDFKELRVSKNRKGRNELVQALVKAQEERKDKFSSIKNVFGV
jgi:hypothetical protein